MTMSESDNIVCGDDLVSIATRDPREAQRRARQLRESEHWLDVVPGIDSIVVQFDAARLDVSDAVDALRETVSSDVDDESVDMPLIEIPVVYGGDGGPDLDWLCDEIGMTEREFVALHARDEYRVDMLGFTPGFAYVGDLDERLDVPRLAEPRVEVGAGSIGIAGGRTGIYALAGPGGWPLIGRTQMILFEPESDTPFVLEPGMRIRFRPVTEPSE